MLKAAHDVLGDNAIAVTARSCSFPKRELNEAVDFCKKEGIRHFRCDSEELKIEGFAQNPKKQMLSLVNMNFLKKSKKLLMKMELHVLQKAPIWTIMGITGQDLKQLPSLA